MAYRCSGRAVERAIPGSMSSGSPSATRSSGLSRDVSTGADRRAVQGKGVDAGGEGDVAEAVVLNGGLGVPLVGGLPAGAKPGAPDVVDATAGLASARRPDVSGDQAE